MNNPLEFLKETKAELTKVVWPSRKETIRMTIVVVILSLVVAAFLGGIDFGLTKLFEFLLNK